MGWSAAFPVLCEIRLEDFKKANIRYVAVNRYHRNYVATCSIFRNSLICRARLFCNRHSHPTGSGSYLLPAAVLLSLDYLMHLTLPGWTSCARRK